MTIDQSMAPAFISREPEKLGSKEFGGLFIGGGAKGGEPVEIGHPDIDGGKGSRKVEAIPALQTPISIHRSGNEHDWAVGSFGDAESTLAKFVARSTRSIRGESDVAARCQTVQELSGGAEGPLATGAPNRSDSHEVKKGGEPGSISTGTDQARDSSVPAESAVDIRRHEEPVVPEDENDRLLGTREEFGIPRAHPNADAGAPEPRDDAQRPEDETAPARDTRNSVFSKLAGEKFSILGRVTHDLVSAQSVNLTGFPDSVESASRRL